MAILLYLMFSLNIICTSFQCFIDIPIVLLYHANFVPGVENQSINLFGLGSLAPSHHRAFQFGS